MREYRSAIREAILYHRQAIADAQFHIDDPECDEEPEDEDSDVEFDAENDPNNDMDAEDLEGSFEESAESPLDGILHSYLLILTDFSRPWDDEMDWLDSASWRYYTQKATRNLDLLRAALLYDQTPYNLPPGREDAKGNSKRGGSGVRMLGSRCRDGRGGQTLVHPLHLLFYQP
jgi:hypothetical protein